ncbi:MAG: BatA domain-containing protein [Bacteroidia bacterium]|nr:BatA domain-containing protein [Bacteroidia bacterium]
MQFLYPSFLFALGLIAIPIIIHLFNFRKYKRVVFSDIRFLKHLSEQTQKQQKIKEWLILLFRVLAITFLVLAFAQPFIPQKNLKVPSSENFISIYIDNSFSMNASGKNGSLLDQAKQKAIELVNAYPDKQNFSLLTNDFEGKYQRAMSKSEAINALQTFDFSPAHRVLTLIYDRQISLANQMGKASGELFWFSDFQQNMLPLPKQASQNFGLNLIPLEASNGQNIWIDSAWFPEPLLRIGNKNKLQVSIQNQSKQDFENQALVLKLDGVQKAIQNVSCKAGEKIIASLTFSLNDYQWHELSLSITDYPITFDDVYFLSARAQEALSVLVLNDAVSSGAFSRLFKLDSFYAYRETPLQQIDFSKLSQQALVVLNEPRAISNGLTDELRKYIEQGGVILLVPSHNPAQPESIKQFASMLGVSFGDWQKVSTELDNIEIKDPLFANVFSKIPDVANMPKVNSYWGLGPKNQSYRSILTLKNKDPFLVRTKLGKGSFYAMSSSMQEEFSSLSKHPLFVPIMLNLPLQRNKVSMSSFLLGERSNFVLNASGAEKLVTLVSGKQEHLLSVQAKDGQLLGSLNGQIKQAGVFDVKAENAIIGKVAFNYHRGESEQGFINLDDLPESLGAKMLEPDLSLFKSEMVKANQNSTLWKWALLLALVFLLAEVLLLRWWK